MPTMIMIWLVEFILVVLAVILDALVKPDLVAEVNTKSQVSESHGVLCPPSTPELVATVAGISSEAEESVSDGDLSSPPSKPDLVAEVNTKSQVSESHGVLCPPSTPELVATVADISFDAEESVSDGDLSFPPSEPEFACTKAEERYNDPPLPSGHEYEVFLSFRGLDTRKTFTDSLYHFLVNARVNTFRDNEELRTGELIGPNLHKAIAEAKIYIPIFSKNYASSKWCLKELTFMLECMKKKEGNYHMILPVFYDATPTEVQDQTGEYGSALRKHEVKYGTEVPQWRKALSEVGRMKGMDLAETANGYQGKLMTLVVSDVIRKLKKAHLGVIENLVETDDQVETVKQCLRVGENDVRIVGLWGMGGIGKTTLAKVIYNEILDGFECCSFIGNVRERSQSKGLEYLQNLLVADLSRCEWSCFKSTDEGTQGLKGKYRGKKVLILLDDVDDTEKLDALEIRHDSFGPGSRIIITTRDKHVLDRIKVDYIHEVAAMDQDHALKLFCKHAFRRDTPIEEFYNLSNSIVKTTGGLPLALEAIGRCLLSTERIDTKWEEKRKQWKVIPHKKVQDSLQISFDALSPAQKDIFLDIACFFIGEDKNNAIPMWKACEFFPEDAVDVLVAKSLIIVRDDDNKMWMHDQVRNFGREIVHLEDSDLPGERSRLWRGKDAIRVFEQPEGCQKKVKAIRVDLNDESCRFEWQDFGHLRALRFLQLNGGSGTLDVTCGENFLPNLRWIKWPYSPFSFLFKLNLPNLVCLDLPDNVLTDNWDSVQMKELKVLNLSCSKKLKRPSKFSVFTSLERLILSKCKQLRELDSSLNKLKKLKHLDMSGCGSVEELPENLGSLTKLEVLDMSCCTGLKEIPDFIVRMTFLTNLALDDTGITTLPNYIGYLIKLRRLSLRKCRALKKLPETIGRLLNLQTLDLGYCENLVTLSALPGIQQVDEDVELMDEKANLIFLNISGCRMMKKLPSLSNLKMLKILDAKGCTELEELVGLEQLNGLETLDISHCPAIKKLPDFLNFKLKALCISGWTMLEELVGLDQLNVLETLDISDCRAISKSPDLSNFKLLKELRISGWTELEELVGLEQLNGLETLDISHCPAISKSPDLSNFKLLKKLRISGCTKLEELVGLDQLNVLETLDISDCRAISKSPDLSNFKLLKELRISGWTELEELVALDQLNALESLDISECPAMRKLLDLSNFKLLKILFAKGCSALQKLDGLNELHALKKLSISSCKEIKKLPDLSKLKQLEELHVDGCEKLLALMGLSGLKALKIISVSKCKEFKELPDLSTFNQLEEFYAAGCIKLQKLTGLDSLKELRILDISGCEGIAALPNLCKLWKLEKFDYNSSGCEGLIKNWCDDSMDHQELRRVPYFKQVLLDLDLLGMIRLTIRWLIRSLTSCLKSLHKGKTGV